MDVTTLCTVTAALTVLPNRSQFFKYESMTLSCGQLGNSSDWRVMMNTSTKTTHHCHSSRNETDTSSCFIDSVFPLDTGVYWCESEAGGRSNIVNISVTDGDVILEAPVHPVAEGDDVTLRCKRKSPSSNLTAYFYKGSLPVLSSATGNMTVHKVSKSDEGPYRCVSGTEESPDSWLTVAGACLWLVLMLLCLRSCLKGKSDPDLSYTDVVITPGDKPQRTKDADASSTEYSMVKLAPPNRKQQHHC